MVGTKFGKESFEMARIEEKPLMGKVILGGGLTCVTGLHIGAARESLEIGGVDSPVLRDPISRAPYIPGSSLKGKLRCLFERKENKQFNRSGGGGVWRHECTDPRCEVCRLFGATGAREGENIPSRLVIRDCRLTESSLDVLSKIETGLQYTELKFENSLDRVTAASNPRQLERVPAGAEFEFEIVYNVETSNNGEVSEDLNNLLETINLLQDDYLGGHGSRGYGKVRFKIETFLGRKIDYYAANTDQEREKASVSSILEEKTIAECKAKMEEVLSIFR